MINMGMYPRQEFIYGIGITKEINGEMLGIQDEEHLFDLIDEFCEENDYGYAIGGDNGDSWNSGIVIGVKRPNYLFSCDCTSEMKYVGGYHTAEFDVEKFFQWCEEAKTTLTKEDVEKINAFLKTSQEPQMYTISTRQ